MLKYHFKITDKTDSKVYFASAEGGDFDEAYDNLLEVYCYELDCFEDNLEIEFLHNGLNEAE